MKKLPQVTQRWGRRKAHTGVCAQPALGYAHNQRWGVRPAHLRWGRERALRAGTARRQKSAATLEDNDAYWDWDESKALG